MISVDGTFLFNLFGMLAEYELARHDERRVFPAGLVDDGLDLELVTVMRPAFNETSLSYSQYKLQTWKRSGGCRGCV
jgi:hypothetical protein